MLILSECWLAFYCHIESGSVKSFWVKKKIKLNYIIKSDLNSFNIKAYYEYNYFINTYNSSYYKICTIKRILSLVGLVYLFIINFDCCFLYDNSLNNSFIKQL